MREEVFRVEAFGASPTAGKVVWAPVKSIWFNTCLVGFVSLAPFFTTVGSVMVFAFSTYLTLLFGHSLGMHRKLIHRTYDSVRWLEYLLVYLGTVVGMAGPLGLIRIHDIRDWAQREADCHDFFSHRASFWQDALWQLNCRFQFDFPPILTIEPQISSNKFFVFLERTWILQQLPISAALYAAGGVPWVVWGVFGRVVVSVAGHWTVTYVTHNPGPGRWFVTGAGVQASNLAGYGLITMGECWHNNHHAFPESARMGLDENEFDPGWEILRRLEKTGLVWNIRLPRSTRRRDDLVRSQDVVEAQREIAAATALLGRVDSWSQPLGPAGGHST